MIVRHWNSSVYTIITMDEWRLAEDKAGKNSAFARTINFVPDSFKSIESYLNYLNSNKH